MRIKIFDKGYNQLTTLINSSSASDFNDLSYSNKVNDIGDASFTVRIDNGKITPASVAHFNRIAVTDDDGTVRWNGVIVEKTITKDLIQIRCYGLAYLLNKRVTGEDEVHNGPASGEISELLASANLAEATGIIAGDIDLTTAVNLTFNRAKVWQSMQSIATGADGQILINNDRTLDFKSVVGQDLTASVIFRYEKLAPKIANILKFQIADSGRDIISKTYGESGGFLSAQENSTIKNQYGLLEDFKNFREINDQTTLDNSSISNNKDSQLNPTIQLSPAVPDNFEAGDIVLIKLSNGFIELNGNYQITEKTVTAKNNQKSIVIKINEEAGSFANDFKKIKNNLDLLNTAV